MSDNIKNLNEKEFSLEFGKIRFNAYFKKKRVPKTFKPNCLIAYYDKDKFVLKDENFQKSINSDSCLTLRDLVNRNMVSCSCDLEAFANNNTFGDTTLLKNKSFDYKFNMLKKNQKLVDAANSAGLSVNDYINQLITLSTQQQNENVVSNNEINKNENNSGGEK